MHGADQSGSDARFRHSVTGALHQMQLGAVPASGQLMRGAGRADHVLTPLHDDGGDVADPMKTSKQLVIFKKTAVLEVMALKPRKGPDIAGRHADILKRSMNTGQRIFPMRPDAGMFDLDGLVPAEQAFVIGRNHIGPLGLGDGGAETGPDIGVKPRSAPAIEPVQILPPSQKHPA